MATAYARIYLNSVSPRNLVLAFSGNKNDIRSAIQSYENMSKEEFIQKHPKFEKMCDKGFGLIVVHG